MKIDIRYDQKFVKNKDTQKILDAFGLDTIKNNTVVKDFDLEIHDGKIYYICGYSGSGKSSILKEIHRQLKDTDDHHIIYIEKWQELSIENKPLIEFFTDTPSDERLSILANCGLGEAWKFISRYDELSDGEKFRFILYHSIMTLSKSKAAHRIIIFDEFCATLDRTSAKAVANNIPRLRDSFAITFILASAHDDLIEYLHADYNIFKEYHERVEVSDKS